VGPEFILEIAVLRLHIHNAEQCITHSTRYDKMTKNALIYR